MKISVVILVYNEIDTNEEILARVDKVSINKVIIVIDGSSMDGTRKRLKKETADL
jgi:glycosyltransferase involved in cell wall biosynthesis